MALPLEPPTGNMRTNIRFTPDRHASIFDAMSFMFQASNKCAGNLFRALTLVHPKLRAQCTYHHFQGQGQRPTPVAPVPTIIEIVLIEGRKRKRYWTQEDAVHRLDLLCRSLGVDLQLACEMCSQKGIELAHVPGVLSSPPQTEQPDDDEPDNGQPGDNGRQRPPRRSLSAFSSLARTADLGLPNQYKARARKQLTAFLKGREFETGTACRMPLKDLVHMVTMASKRGGWALFGPGKPISEKELTDQLAQLGFAVDHLSRVVFNTRTRSGLFVLGMQHRGATHNDADKGIIQPPESSRSPLEYLDWQDRWRLDGNCGRDAHVLAQTTAVTSAYECPCGYVAFHENLRAVHSQKCSVSPTMKKLEGVTLEVITEAEATRLRSAAEPKVQGTIKIAKITALFFEFKGLPTTMSNGKAMVARALESTEFVTGVCARTTQHEDWLFRNVKRSLARVTVRSTPVRSRWVDVLLGMSPDDVRAHLKSAVARLSPRLKPNRSYNEQPGVPFGERVFKLSAYRCTNKDCIANHRKKMWLNRQTAYLHRAKHADCSTSVQASMQYFKVSQKTQHQAWDEGLQETCTAMAEALEQTCARHEDTRQGALKALFELLTAHLNRRPVPTCAGVGMALRIDPRTKTTVYKLMAAEGWHVFETGSHLISAMLGAAVKRVRACKELPLFNKQLDAPYHRHHTRPLWDLLDGRKSWIRSVMDSETQHLLDELSAAFLGPLTPASPAPAPEGEKSRC